ncbi:uncharacterized protein LOC113873330 [Abrus precatorius]|uniref:Uncharacterized protein LOC113873330 n=1 Tax=Abrus precatorius TaxID=3816 RepID=A0A8B8MH48_ABRPR|nr:uncharacterized protein LOC113873330 [Abrus precatorius]
MVFTGLGEEESMALGLERSKPLHNFMLPCLKWGSQRHLRCMKVPSDSSADAGDRLSPATTAKRELEPPPNNAGESTKRARVIKPRIHGDDGIDAVREKLMLDLKTEADRMKDEILGKEAAEENDGEAVPLPPVTMEEDAPAPAAGARTWNLRTRRAPVVGDGGKGLRFEEKRASSSSPLRTHNGAVKLRGSPEKEEKVKFCMALSKKEIEEDFMKLVGHRPPRRPKKRPRIVQKQLDTLFPGMWLSEVTADSYKVPEVPENSKR